MIGIDASRAFINNRTGIEEYSFHVIKHLREPLKKRQVVLYIREVKQLHNHPTTPREYIEERFFSLPPNWRVKVLSSPRLWTYFRLSLELLLHPVDTLFIPGHVVPPIHPKNTFVTIHGIEYERVPQAYSLWERFSMRVAIKNSCRWARHIITPSQSSKDDIKNLYRIPDKKISVVYEGLVEAEKNDRQEMRPHKEDYLFFVGRIETRKNIKNIVRAFELIKKQHRIPHKLVLAGKHGYGYKGIKQSIQTSPHKNDIIELGYVSQKEKEAYLKHASVFLFPTLYEGFGLPVLEAQAMGVPVVTANASSFPEIACVSERSKRGGARFGLCSALLVDPYKPQEIAKAIHMLLTDETTRNAIIARSLKNVKRFSWKICAQEIAEVLKK